MSYQRTTGYRNYLNRRCYLPRVIGTGIVELPSGARYIRDIAGWRRIKDK
jgi:hypothetical protein